MNYISFFQKYSQDRRASDIIDYIDNSINESVSLKSLVSKTFNKIKSLGYKGKKKVLSYLLLVLMSATSIENAVSEISRNSKNLDPKDKKVVEEVIKKKTPFKKGYNYSISDEGLDMLKGEERLKLKAYSIGDGMVTVGWGHAEPKSDSKYKVGDEISKKEAEELLRKDLKDKEEGVKRIFKQWENKGIYVPITQGMYDALVSLAYNSGVNGVRRSDFIQELKSGNYQEAAKLIKSFNTSEKFPGLERRRMKEHDLFTSDI